VIIEHFGIRAIHPNDQHEMISHRFPIKIPFSLATLTSYEGKYDGGNDNRSVYMKRLRVLIESDSSTVLLNLRGKFANKISVDLPQLDILFSIAVCT
jgi:hypothetical protein